MVIFAAESSKVQLTLANRCSESVLHPSSRVTFGFQEQDRRNSIPVILRTHRLLGKMSKGSMELTEQHDNDSVASEDTISLDALSAEELAYIAKNPKYSQLLAELLHGPDQTGEGALPGLVASADHTTTILSRESGSQAVEWNTPPFIATGKGSEWATETRVTALQRMRATDLPPLTREGSCEHTE